MGVPTTTREDEERVAIATPDEERTARQPGGLRNSLGSALSRPLRDRSPRRPRLWFEIALIGVSYWIYSLIRNAVPEHEATAQANAQWVWDTQAAMGLAFEQAVNHAVNNVTWLIVGMNYYYATLHFIVTIAVLVWLYRWQPGRYAAARTALFATTAVALVGYYFFPLAPPRLMAGMDFVDTVLVHGTWGSMASGDMANVSNQYAAMPSMHIGWSAWCGVIMVLLARRRWVRLLGVLYPAGTLVVIVATANHFWLDAVGGLLCLALGFAFACAWYRAHPHQLPREVTERAAETAEVDDNEPEDRPEAPTPVSSPERGGSQQARVSVPAPAREDSHRPRTPVGASARAATPSGRRSSGAKSS